MSKDELITKLYESIQDQLITKDFCSITNKPGHNTNYFVFEEKDNVFSVKIAQCKLADEPESKLSLPTDIHLDDSTIDFINPSILAPAIARSIDEIILYKIYHIEPTYLWSRRVPPLEEKREYCKSFLFSLAFQCRKVYQKNKGYFPNVLLVNPEVLPILELTGKLTHDPSSKVGWSYKVGTLELENSINLTVYVVPQLYSGEYALIAGIPDRLVFPYALDYSLDLDTTDGITIKGCKYHFKDTMSINVIAKGKVID